MKKRKKKVDWEKRIFWFVLITMIASAIYSIVNIVLAPSGTIPTIPYGKVKSDYVLMLIQCILGIILMFLPSLIEHKLCINVPSYMHIVLVVFLYAAIYLGEIRSFYYRIPNWDIILHTFSGSMLGALGFSIVNLLNDMENVKIKLSPLFVAVFAFCFALSLGALWEIYEFSFDGILGLNMQKFAFENGTPMIGRAALSDTMEDLIVDTLGAFIISVVGYLSLKYKKGWIQTFSLKKESTTL